MKTLKINQMEAISAGTFCQGVAAVDLIYGGGVLLNLWNPVGWGSGAALIAMNGYCFIKSFD